MRESNISPPMIHTGENTQERLRNETKDFPISTLEPIKAINIQSVAL